MTPDVNLLVAASRADHPLHRPALAWLGDAIEQCRAGARLLILPMVATGFLRVATHPKVFVEPTPPDDAIAFMEALLAAAGSEMPSLGGEWPVLCQLCRAGSLSGNDVPDAWIAAAVTALGDHLYTFDRDFTRLLPRRACTVLAGARA